MLVGGLFRRRQPPRAESLPAAHTVHIPDVRADKLKVDVMVGAGEVDSTDDHAIKAIIGVVSTTVTTDEGAGQQIEAVAAGAALASAETAGEARAEAVHAQADAAEAQASAEMAATVAATTAEEVRAAREEAALARAAAMTAAERLDRLETLLVAQAELAAEPPVVAAPAAAEPPPDTPPPSVEKPTKKEKPKWGMRYDGHA